jgi:hydrogenase maturation protease
MTARVIVGIGNRWRHDDGAGLEVIRRLEALPGVGARLIRHEGEGAGLLDAWAGADEAVVVDAASSGAPAGTVHRPDATGKLLSTGVLRSSTHAFGLPEAIELGRALERLPSQLLVYAIEGRDFSAGQGLTEDVAAAVNAVAGELRAFAEQAQLHFPGPHPATDRKLPQPAIGIRRPTSQR